MSVRAMKKDQVVWAAWPASGAERKWYPGVILDEKLTESSPSWELLWLGDTRGRVSVISEQNIRDFCGGFKEVMQSGICVSTMNYGRIVELAIKLAAAKAEMAAAVPKEGGDLLFQFAVETLPSLPPLFVTEIFHQKRRESQLSRQSSMGHIPNSALPGSSWETTSEAVAAPKKRRGRPPGSRNKQRMSVNSNPLSSRQSKQPAAKVRRSEPTPPKPQLKKHWRQAAHPTPEQIELLRVPLEHGWKRELVFRSSKANRLGDIYYHSPTGKKLRSGPEISTYLSESGVMNLDKSNFNFSPEVRTHHQMEITHGAYTERGRPPAEAPVANALPEL